MLADALTELEFIKGLSQNWPLLAVFLGALWWFARFIAHPLTTRHIAFIDAIDERDRARTKTDAEHATTLETIKKETEETNSRLVSMDKNWKCLAVGPVPTMHPTRGA
jgi:hypothetical protein